MGIYLRFPDLITDENQHGLAFVQGGELFQSGDYVGSNPWCLNKLQVRTRVLLHMHNMLICLLTVLLITF